MLEAAPAVSQTGDKFCDGYISIYMFVTEEDNDAGHEKLSQLEDNVAQLQTEVDSLKTKNNVSIYC